MSNYSPIQTKCPRNLSADSQQEKAQSQGGLATRGTVSANGQKTELARKIAEDSRKGAEESKAKADMAYKTEFKMTTDQYLALRALEIEKEKIEMVKSKNNVHIVMNSGGGAPATPMFKIK